MIDKTEIFNIFCREGDVYITILTKGSKVPPHILKKKTETFVIGKVSTPNVICGQDGINAPMRFSGKYFDCFFPWDCIVSILGKDAMIYFTLDVNGLARREDTDKKNAVDSEVKKKRHLKIVK